MDLRTLQTFAAVLRHGGFSAAARELCVTQPTVSKAVRQLEEDLGVPLLERTATPLRATAEGLLVLRRAEAMLAERERLLAELAGLRGLERGRLRLGLARLGSSVLFAGLVAEFRRRHPQVDLELVEHGSLHLERALREGELDLAMVMLPVAADLDGLPVHDEPLMALLPPEHPLAGRRRVTLPELAGSPFILFEQGFALNPRIAAGCQRSGFTPRVAAYSGQPEFIQALVAAGLGVAFLPRLVCRALRPLRPPVPCVLLDDPELRWRITLAWRREAPLPPSAEAYLELTRAALGAGVQASGLAL
jgi:DNA-binding transcriptional LysR family regulator